VKETAVPTASKSKEKTLRELRELTGTLYVSNNTMNKITCHETVGDQKVDFELEPQGNDDSIRILPKAALEVPGFQRLWLTKAVTVSDDPDMEQQITLLMAGRAGVTDSRLSELVGMVEVTSTDKDLVQMKCLETGEIVFQNRAQVKEGVPPLVARFAEEAPKWKATPATNEAGATVFTWSKTAH
jgi:hypothetical protein